MIKIQCDFDWVLILGDGADVSLVFDINAMDEDAPTISISREQASAIGHALIAAAGVEREPQKERKPAVPWYVVQGYGDAASAARDGVLPPKK